MYRKADVITVWISHSLKMLMDLFEVYIYLERKKLVLKKRFICFYILHPSSCRAFEFIENLHCIYNSKICHSLKNGFNNYCDFLITVYTSTPCACIGTSAGTSILFLPTDLKARVKPVTSLIGAWLLPWYSSFYWDKEEWGKSQESLWMLRKMSGKNKERVNKDTLSDTSLPILDFQLKMVHGPGFHKILLWHTQTR